MLRTAQDEVAGGIDQLFDRLLAVPADPRKQLYEAMRHAAIAGGKRLRPLLYVLPPIFFMSIARSACVSARRSRRCTSIR